MIITAASAVTASGAKKVLAMCGALNQSLPRPAAVNLPGDDVSRPLKTQKSVML